MNYNYNKKKLVKKTQKAELCVQFHLTLNIIQATDSEPLAVCLHHLEY